MRAKLFRLTDDQLKKLKPGTKILFANFPADGHFNPLTGLAAHLKAIGCDVRWYTSRHYAAKIEKLGLPFYPLKRALDYVTEAGGINWQFVFMDCLLRFIS